MPDALEISLAEVLRRAADAAPEPAADAGEALLRERARRAGIPRSRMLTLAAAITVLIVLAAVVTVLELVAGDEDMRPITPPVRIIHTDYEDGAPITDVWPDAVRTVPATIPINGRPNPFNVERVLPDGQLLVTPVGEESNISHLWALNPATGKARPVSPSGEWVTVVGQQVDAGEVRWIAWISQPSGAAEPDAPVYLWYAPASGGKARKALSTPISTSGGVDQSAVRVLIDGDTLIVTPALKKEKGQASSVVRTVRIGEDRIRTVPDAAGMTVLQWPWLSDARTPGHRTIRNAETGELRQARLPADWTDVDCSLSWCVGRQGGRIMVSPRDGSQARPLANGKPDIGVVRDRFLFVSGRTVYDLQTRKTLTLPRAAGEQNKVWVSISIIGEGGGTPMFAWVKSDASEQMESYLLIDAQAMV
ncbi:hypothetical protein [Cryptosporangium minutisporangium]|uniref:Uncharacterized protein n=1 Tax=Cryptosporangium minutisporangium TaxID=113569 RepID=A0ABP6T9M2_9ACTN